MSLYDDSPDILEVFWTKNGDKIDSRGSGGRLSEVTIDNPSIIIRDVNVVDAGNYQLTAVNAVGSTTSDVIVLGIYIYIQSWGYAKCNGNVWQCMFSKKC